MGAGVMVEWALDSRTYVRYHVEMTNQDLAPCQAMVSIEDGEPLARRIQQHIDRLPNEALKQAVVDLKRHIDTVSTLLALHVKEVDERSLPTLDHGISTTNWLMKRCQMPESEASGTVKTARALSHMPTIADNALNGQVPWRSVRLLSQARDRYPQEFSVHEGVFADVATYLSVKDLRRAIGHWEQQVSYDDAVRDAKKLEVLRGLHHNQTLDGLWATKGTFAPEGGDLIDTALNSLVHASNIRTGEIRSPRQRRADALVDICRFWLDHNETVRTSGGEKPHVTITIDYETLMGDRQRLPEIAGAPVDPEAIKRILCDAGVVRILLDSESQPIDVGRRVRTIPPALRRALELRDGGCTWGGCTAPTSWCDAHHIIHWVNGGATSLDNTRLLCRPHHRSVHKGREGLPRGCRPIRSSELRRAPRRTTGRKLGVQAPRLANVS